MAAGSQRLLDVADQCADLAGILYWRYGLVFNLEGGWTEGQVSLKWTGRAVETGQKQKKISDFYSNEVESGICVVCWSI